MLRFPHKKPPKNRAVKPFPEKNSLFQVHGCPFLILHERLHRKSEASIYTLSLRTKIAAAFFDAEKHLAKFSGAETPDAKSLEHYLKDRLSEYLQDLDEEIQRRLITLIVEGACANDIKYRPLADCWRDSLSRKGMIG